MKTVFILFSVLAFLCVNIWGVIYMLGARKRSWIMALIRIGITLVSTVISIPLSKLLASWITDLVYPSLASELGSDLGGALDQVPAAGEGLRVIAALVAAPILFIVVFLLLRFVLALTMWIVERKVPVLKKPYKLSVTMPLGALNGILIGVVTLIPLCGFLAFGSELLHTVERNGVMETEIGRELLADTGIEEEDLSELADRMGGNVAVKVIHGTVGKPVFKALTTAKMDASATHGKTVKLHLETELCGLVTVASDFAEVMDVFEKDDFTEQDREALDGFVDSMFESEWISMVMTDTLTSMSGSWLDQKPFLGIDRPVMDATINPTVNRMLEVLTTETPDTLEEDVRIILDVVGDLLANGILAKDDVSYMDLVTRMGQDKLLSSLLAKLDVNPRLHVLSVELKNLSIRLVTNMLGADLLKDGRYDGMMENVASSLTDVLTMSDEERDAAIVEAIRENFSAEGYDVPEDVALEMSNKMLDELGEDGEITADELKEYMLTHADEGFDIVGDEVLDELP